MKIIILFLFIYVAMSTYADDIQAKLMSIALKEAEIANISANKYMMLYGIKSPIATINRWNQLEHHPTLSNEQIEQINALEKQKQQFLQRAVK